MADLELKGELNLMLNAEDLADQIDALNRRGQGEGGRSPNVVRQSLSGGIGGLLGVDALMNIVSRLVRSLGGLLKTIVLFPKHIADLARSFADASPRLRRAFYLFDRSMFLFRRKVGNIIAPTIERLLAIISEAAHNNAELVAKGILVLGESAIIAAQALVKLGPVIQTIIEKTSDYVKNSKLGLVAIDEAFARQQIREWQGHPEEVAYWKEQLRLAQLRGNRIAQGIDPDGTKSPLEEMFAQLLKTIRDIQKGMQTESDKDALAKLREQAGEYGPRFLGSLDAFLGPAPSMDTIQRRINPQPNFSP